MFAIGIYIASIYKHTKYNQLFKLHNSHSNNKLYILVTFRYLVVLYYQSNKAFKKVDAEKKEAELLAMKAKYGLATPGRAEREKAEGTNPGAGVGK